MQIHFMLLFKKYGIGNIYGNSSGRVRGGPAFWFENLTAEISKIVNKKNN